MPIIVSSSNVSLKVQSTGLFAISASQATTASYALNTQNVVSSSYSSTSSFTLGTIATSSLANFAQTASIANSINFIPQTASYALSSSEARHAQTASFAISASYAKTASFATTSAFAITAATASSITFVPATASYAVNAGTALNAAVAQVSISSSYAVTSSFSSTASFALTAGGTPNTGSYTGSFTGAFQGDGTGINNVVLAQTASFISTASEGLIISPSASTFIRLFNAAQPLIQIIGSQGSSIVAQVTPQGDDQLRFNGTTMIGQSSGSNAFFGQNSSIFLGTSSLAVNAVNAQTASALNFTPISASYALTASFALNAGGSPNTGSYTGSFTGAFAGNGINITGIVSSSYATTASFASSASNAITAQTASVLLGSIQSASFAITASAATTITFIPATASFALTAGTTGGGLVGQGQNNKVAVFTGISSVGTGSITDSGSTGGVITSASLTVSGSHTLFGTSSQTYYATGNVLGIVNEQNITFDTPNLQIINNIDLINTGSNVVKFINYTLNGQTVYGVFSNGKIDTIDSSSLQEITIDPSTQQIVLLPSGSVASSSLVFAKTGSISSRGILRMLDDQFFGTASFATNASSAFSAVTSSYAFNTATASLGLLAAATGGAFIKLLLNPLAIQPEIILFGSGSTGSIVAQVSNTGIPQIFINGTSSLIQVPGSPVTYGDPTARFLGTASFATSVISSSYTTTASFATTASAASSLTFTPATASYALTASFASNTIGPYTGSFTGSLLGSSSFATTASAATSITFTPVSSSYSLTASFALTAGGTPNTGSYTGSFTGSVQGTSSYATSASFASSSYTTLTASAATSITFTPATSSYAVNAGNANNASFAPNGFTITGTLAVSGNANHTGYAVTASAFSGSIASASFASSSYTTLTASAATSITFVPATASFATTASAATSITFVPVTASYAVNAGASNTATSSSFATTSSAATSITFIPVSSSYATTSSYSSVAQNVLGSITSASYALTSSYATVAQNVLGSISSASFASTASLALTASFAQTIATAVSLIPVTIPFATTYDGNILIQSLPSASQEISTNLRTKIDLTTFASAALSVRVIVSGTAGSELRAQYSTDENTWNYLDGAAGPTVALTSVGSLLGSNILLQGAAQAPVVIRLITVGGNDTASVQLGNISFVGIDKATTNTTPGTVSSASVAVSSSYALNAGTAQNANYAPNGFTITGTLAVSGNANHTGYAVTASAFNGDGSQIINLISSSYALSASFANRAYTASLLMSKISSSLTQITGNVDNTNFFISSSGFSGSGANITNITAANITGTVVSSSYALTASFALNAGISPNTGSYTGSFTGSVLGSSSFATTASAATSITFTSLTGSLSGSWEPSTLLYGPTTTPYTASGLDAKIYGDTRSGSFSILLPDSNLSGRILIIKPFATASLTIVASGSQTFNSSASFTLSTATSSIELVSKSGSNGWTVINGTGDAAAFEQIVSSSFAQNALTANTSTSSSFATTASAATSITFVPATATSASFAQNALTANTATSASFATTASAATSITFVPASSSYAGTASLLLGSIQSASYALTSSYAVSSSWAITAATASSLFLVSSSGLQISGNLAVSGNITALGYAISASFISGNGANITGVVSSSYALTASFAANAGGTVTSASYAGTASLLLGSIQSASYALTSSYASYADTASMLYFVSASGIAVTGNLYVSGVIDATGFTITASGFSGSIASSSYAATASLLLGSIVSASYALTASYAANAGAGGGGTTTGSFTGSFTGAFKFTGGPTASLQLLSNATASYLSGSYIELFDAVTNGDANKGNVNIFAGMPYTGSILSGSTQGGINFYTSGALQWRVDASGNLGGMVSTSNLKTSGSVSASQFNFVSGGFLSPYTLPSGTVLPSNQLFKAPQNIAGRLIEAHTQQNSINPILQTSLYKAQIFQMTAGGGSTLVSDACLISTSGSITHIDNSDSASFMAVISSSAAVSGSAIIQTFQRQVIPGSIVAGANGFFYSARVNLIGGSASYAGNATGTTGSRAFIGFNSVASGGLFLADQTSLTSSCVGFLKGFGTADPTTPSGSTNWQFVVGTGTTGSYIDTGMPVVTGSVFDFTIYCVPTNAGVSQSIQWRIDNRAYALGNTASFVQGGLPNLTVMQYPSPSASLYSGIWLLSYSAASVPIAFQNIYVETSR